MESVRSRLKELEANLTELEDFRTLGRTEVKNNRRMAWALRYGMLESIQIVIDVACAIVSQHDLGYPKSYAECLQILADKGWIPSRLCERLVQAVGMRNVLVHEYLDVNDRLVFSALDNLDDFRAFARAIVRSLE